VVTTLVRYAGNVTRADHYNQIRRLPDEMNHRGSGVTEDSSAKYAKERQKFFGFHFRNQYLGPSLKIGGLEKFNFFRELRPAVSGEGGEKWPSKPKSRRKFLLLTVRTVARKHTNASSQHPCQGS
jgi:hypothetical protein